MFCASMILSCFLHALPPKKYDYEPRTSYNVIILPEKQANELCRQKVWGCALIGKKNSVIIIRNTLKGKFLDIVLRHEKAHINGWRH